MDKFAVDLEKVLDDFEYNEGREETVLPPVINNLSSHNSQKRHKPPATVYRRPTFEPINLSDADFSAASITSSDNFIKAKEDYTVNNVGYTQPFVVTSTENIETKGNDKENRITRNDDITIESNDKETTYSDGTPDLLDSNTLKPNQNNSDTEDPNLISNQLPDITSVSTTHITPAHPPVADETQSASFDLINPTAQPLPFDENKLPPIVDVGLVINEQLPEIKVKPISFVSIDTDVSEAELEDYLHNLEINANIECATEVSESITPVIVGTSVSNESSTSTDIQPEIILDKYEEEKCSVELNEQLNKEDTCSLERVNTSQDINEIVSEVLIQPNITEETDEVIKDQEYQSVPEVDKVNEPDNETLQTMCENIQSINKKASSIGDLEIISTQITEYKINEEITNKEDINESSNINNPILENSTEEIQIPSSSSDDTVVNSEQIVEEIPSQVEEESTSVKEQQNIDGVSDSQLSSNEESKPNRPSSLALESSQVVECDESPTPTNTVANNSCGPASPMEKLGKFPPFWVPDTESDYCMQCQNKFTVIRRRHHCRACGLVLCSKCCNLKAPLEYLDFAEARVCQPCFNIIYRVSLEDGRYNLGRQPNPNNPMEYCSTIPPLQQAASTINQPPPSVLVPTGVLKREGRAKSDVPKQVIFSDGIRPGGDLTELDGPSESRILPRRGIRRLATPPGGKTTTVDPIIKRPLDPTTQSFIPADTNLPPLVYTDNGQLVFSDEIPKITDEPLKFAINYNLFVSIKKVKLDCCVNRLCWSVCSEGLTCVGQDEIAIILECLPDETLPPQDLFNLINVLYQESSKGTTVSEMCFTPSTSNTLFGSKDHGGFLYIRPTFQCTTNLLLPSQPYLIAILVHRWETPWARLFPLRLVLRLGAEYRYYPCPLVSIRNRQPLYTDIGHTVMKVLVDFRKYSYSLATVRGLLIHMEDRQTTILFPRNRYDQVVRALNNSNESVLAFGANLSLKADSHLVCIQGTKDENTYHTQAINIHNKPRRVTGASFVVFNGALKIPGLSGKSSIMEDGLMVHLPSDSMTSLRTALREMQDYTISCGPNEEETVYLQWTEDDTNFNVGVKSCIDGKLLDGIPSIRVHNGTDYPGNHKIIRWTEVFILQSEDGRKATDPLDISRVSESLARATCMALVPDLDSLAAANLTVLAIRATIHPDSVGYEVGSCGNKLPSVYMKRLDEELVPVIHQAAVASQDTPAVLELTFRVMNHP